MRYKGERVVRKQTRANCHWGSMSDERPAEVDDAYPHERRKVRRSARRSRSARSARKQNGNRRHGGLQDGSADGGGRARRARRSSRRGRTARERRHPPRRADDAAPPRSPAARLAAYRPGVLALGLAAVAVFAGFVLWPALSAQADARKNLAAASALLAQARSTVSTIDKQVDTQLSTDAAPGVPSTAAETLVARRELRQAVKLADEAAPHLAGSERERAALTKSSASARLVMIDRAPAILVASAKAVRAKTLGDQAWRQMQLASRTETTAASNYGKGTPSGVEAAAVSVNVIKERLGDARRLFSEAASASPEAGFDRYVAYTDSKAKEAAQLGRAATQWLDFERSAAAVTFKQYRAHVARSSAALELLPGAPGYATGEGFRKVAGGAADAYTKAKKQAAQADRALANL